MSSYITGFVDGEGSFLVSFSKRPRLSTKIEVRPSFSVSQHKRNEIIVRKIQDFFSCGAVRFSKRDHNYRYETRSLKDLIEIIIPHFENCPLQTSKQKDFQLFKEICSLMREQKHLSQVGLRQIISLAYRMNNLGSRRYRKEDLLKIVGKMKV